METNLSQINELYIGRQTLPSIIKVLSILALYNPDIKGVSYATRFEEQDGVHVNSFYKHLTEKQRDLLRIREGSLKDYVHGRADSNKTEIEDMIRNAFELEIASPVFREVENQKLFISTISEFFEGYKDEINQREVKTMFHDLAHGEGDLNRRQIKILWGKIITPFCHKLNESCIKNNFNISNPQDYALVAMPTAGLNQGAQLKCTPVLKSKLVEGTYTLDGEVIIPKAEAIPYLYSASIDEVSTEAETLSGELLESFYKPLQSSTAPGIKYQTGKEIYNRSLESKAFASVSENNPIKLVEITNNIVVIEIPESKALVVSFDVNGTPKSTAYDSIEQAISAALEEAGTNENKLNEIAHLGPVKTPKQDRTESPRLDSKDDTNKTVLSRERANIQTLSPQEQKAAISKITDQSSPKYAPRPLKHEGLNEIVTQGQPEMVTGFKRPKRYSETFRTLTPGLNPPSKLRGKTKAKQESRIDVPQTITGREDESRQLASKSGSRSQSKETPFTQSILMKFLGTLAGASTAVYFIS